MDRELQALLDCVAEIESLARRLRSNAADADTIESIASRIRAQAGDMENLIGRLHQLARR
jgi:hypothetical protein